MQSQISAGEIRRLRMVHGGNRDSINVKIVKADLSALFQKKITDVTPAQLDRATTLAMGRLANNRTAAARAVNLDNLCKGEVVKQFEIALDGITRTEMVEREMSVLQPGYRSDVLVSFPSPGLYCILDEGADASATLTFAPRRALLKIAAYWR